MSWREVNPAGFGHDGFDKTVHLISLVQWQNVAATFDHPIWLCVVAHQHMVMSAVDLVQRERVPFGRIKREIVPP